MIISIFATISTIREAADLNLMLIYRWTFEKSNIGHNHKTKQQRKKNKKTQNTIQKTKAMSNTESTKKKKKKKNSKKGWRKVWILCFLSDISRVAHSQAR